MEENVLLSERQGQICTLIINRPDKRNSLTPALLMQLADKMEVLRNDSSVRVIILRGAGDQAFSSGYDISQIPTKGTEAPPPVEILNRALETIAVFPYPVIGMLNDHTMGAGFELAATCDLRLASESALFAVPPARLGVLYSYSGTRRFINLLGVAATKEILFTGKPFDAKRAWEIGFLNRVAPLKELSDITYKMAQEIAENAPLSVKGAKRMISVLLSYQQLSAGHRMELDALIQQCFQSEDLKEGQQAFLERRKPKFQGK